MSIPLIQQYYSSVDKLIRYGGTRNEMSLLRRSQGTGDRAADAGVHGQRGDHEDHPGNA